MVQFVLCMVHFGANISLPLDSINPTPHMAFINAKDKKDTNKVLQCTQNLVNNYSPRGRRNNEDDLLLNCVRNGKIFNCGQFLTCVHFFFCIFCGAWWALTVFQDLPGWPERNQLLAFSEVQWSFLEIQISPNCVLHLAVYQDTKYFVVEILQI